MTSPQKTCGTSKKNPQKRHYFMLQEFQEFGEILSHSPKYCSCFCCSFGLRFLRSNVWHCGCLATLRSDRLGRRGTCFVNAVDVVVDDMTFGLVPPCNLHLLFSLLQSTGVFLSTVINAGGCKCNEHHVQISINSIHSRDVLG